ncbi:N-6 DNA methylase [Candidatus Peregrinibacteria bacterium]|jgi:tRNA G10  N-methylase Trm11|nr:N-6 DNA methylase [Candidatus Peregrinibacteria bacterium]
MLYAFKLGKSETLSIAELATVFGKESINLQVNGNVLIESEQEITTDVLNRLGGTMKISEVFGEFKKTELVETITEIILEKMDIERKVTFAINIYPLAYKVKKTLKFLTKNVKNELKQHGAKSRFLNKLSGDIAHNIEGIQSKKEILEKDNTIEINLIQRPSSNPNDDTHTYFLSILIANQDIEGYSRRDYERPFRDTFNGMLPPKLSQILINLAKPKAHSVIIDPFCGSGGVLIEALLMGYSVQGSDINPRMITHTEGNLKWLESSFTLPPLKKNIFVHDATSPFPKREKEAIIATEGYLGPPLKSAPKEETIHNNFQEITTLYLKFFKTLYKTYEKATIAICIPNYLQKGRPHPLSQKKVDKLIQKIESLGFHCVPLSNTKPSINSYLYSRPDQLVGREIVVFSKDKEPKQPDKRATQPSRKS